MAKRKLSPAQRQAIRTSISRDLEAKRAPGEIVKELAEKYGITTVTARWYLKSQESGKHRGKAATGKRSAKPRSRKRIPESRVSSRTPSTSNGRGPARGFVDALESKAAEAVRKVKEARRLFPRWQAMIRREGTLERTRSKAERALGQLRKRARALGARLKSLTGS